MNGPFGNRFPYTNFHEMNLDWMIQIAKDFLDQYTHIQETIENGLSDLDDKTAAGIEALQEKYTALEGLLDQWYNTHSQDIADALSAALLDLQSALDSAESDFSTFATNKAAQAAESIPSDYTTFYNGAFQYRGSLGSGAYTNAKVGVYAVSDQVVTGLPTLNQTYGWLICLVPNSLYFLVDSSSTRNVWYNEAGTGWRQLYPTFFGPLGAGAYTAARTGTYSVDNQSVTGLPYGMTQRYGWLTCVVPNNLYILVESNADKTIWINEANTGWRQIYPGYYGALGAGAYTAARVGTYAVDNQSVTGLPEKMSQRYGWLTCYVPNNLYILVESNNTKTTWIKEANTAWKLYYPEYKCAGLKIVYTGDSIAESRTEGYGDNGGGYPAIIAALTNGTYQNNAHSGATIAVSSAEYNIITLCSALDNDADIICLEGGINDYWLSVPMGTFSESDFTGTVDTTTYCGALESLLRTAIDKWVGKPIIFLIPHKITTTAWTQNNAGYTYKDMREKTIQILNKYSIPYLDLWAEGGLNGYISSLNNAYLNGGSNTHPDGCHPDYEGYRRYYVPRLLEMFNKVTP